MYYICGMINPFIVDSDGFPYKEVVQWKQTKPFSEDGVAVKFVAKGVRCIEKDRYVKVYFDWIEVLRGLSYSGINMLLYVMDIIQYNSDVIILDRDLCCKHSNFGKNVYYRGIKDLVRCGIIMKRGSGVSYWINPHVMFNGNRKVLLG